MTDLALSTASLKSAKACSTLSQGLRCRTRLAGGAAPSATERPPDRVLASGGLLAGAAWVAPAIVSVDAAAAATAPPTPPAPGPHLFVANTQASSVSVIDTGLNQVVAGPILTIAVSRGR